MARAGSVAAKTPSGNIALQAGVQLDGVSCTAALMPRCVSGSVAAVVPAGPTASVRVEFVAAAVVVVHRPMMCVEVVWLGPRASGPADGIYGLLAPVTRGAHVHHAYVFANCMAGLLEVLIYDGMGVWLQTCRLQAGAIAWPRGASGPITLTRDRVSSLAAVRSGYSILGGALRLIADGRTSPLPVTTYGPRAAVRATANL